VQTDIHQYYESRHPGQVVVLGADLFNGAPSGAGSFKQGTGATYPMLLDAALNTGGNIQTLYGGRDHLVVISRQGIVRYQANDRWNYGDPYRMDEVRACVDSLVASGAVVRPGRLLVREPARRPRLEEGSPAKPRAEEAPAGAALRVGQNPARSPVEIVLANPLGRSVEARVTVHDIAGRRVATLLDGPVAPGSTTLRWNGRDPEGRTVPSGIYLAEALIDGTRLSRRIALVR
jgi:hypothetical protein